VDFNRTYLDTIYDFNQGSQRF